MSSLGKNLCVVLVETSHPGNLGAAARAMKTMGFRDLRLVRPCSFPSAEASARAAGADDLLDAARVCNSLVEAVADCVLVTGTTGRSRSLPWPTLSPRRAAPRLAAAATHGRVALVFGNERSGLDNTDLELCHHAICIPTTAAFRSLNLAAAVQLLCYELALVRDEAQAVAEAVERLPEAPLADGREMRLFFDHLEQCLRDVHFLDPEKPRLLMRRLRRLFNRAQPDQNEMNILRGFLASVQRCLPASMGDSESGGTADPADPAARR